MDGHLLWDGEAVRKVIGKVLEGLLHSRVQHVLPRLEPPDIQVVINKQLITVIFLRKENRRKLWEIGKNEGKNMLLRPLSDRCMENIEMTIRFEYRTK